MTLALARKYRPQSFLELVGQDAVVTTLKNAIETQRLHHAYLFCGVRGVGKTSMARILAKSINCEKGPTLTPCQQCQNCITITQGNSLDVIEIDGASHNLVDDVRELRDQVKYLPSQSAYKIIIIDEVHMLTTNAFNALLKTLEEPPRHIIFIFATTESHKLPITILSRCQKYDFRKVSETLLADHLRKVTELEGYALDDSVLHLIAKCGQGSVRDSLSLADQVIRMPQDQLSVQAVRDMLGLADRIMVTDFARAVMNFNGENALQVIHSVDERGVDVTYFVTEVLEIYRDAILLKSQPKAPTTWSPSHIQDTAEIMGQASLSDLLVQYDILYEALSQLARTTIPRLVLDVTVVKMLSCQDMVDLTSLVADLKTKTPAGTNSAPERSSERIEGSRPSLDTLNARNQNSETMRAPSRPVASSLAGPVVQANTALRFENNAEPASPNGEFQEWQQFVSFVVKERPPLGNILREAHPQNRTEDLWQVSFSDASPAKSMAIERTELIENLLLKFFNKKIKFVILQNGEEAQKKKF